MKKGRIVKKLCLLLLTLCMIAGTANEVQAAKTVKAAKVTLNYTQYTLKKGGKINLKAKISPKKATAKKITWSSSNKKVAVVSSKGKVTAKSKGTAKITAAVKGTKVKAVCKVTVGTPVKSLKAKSKSVNLTLGKSTVIKTTISPKNASNKGLTYASSNKKVAVVSSKGKITAKGTGKAKITVTAKDGSRKKTTVSVTVKAPKVSTLKLSPSSAKIYVGEKVALKPSVSPSKASGKVSYKSSNTKVAAVDSKGNVVGKAAGTAKITATAKDGSRKTAQSRITVLNKDIPVTGVKLAVKDNKTRIQVGETTTVTATVEPSTAANRNVTFASSRKDVAAVDQNGKVTGIKPGTARITVETQEGKKTAAVDIVVADKTNPSPDPTPDTEPIKVTGVKLNVKDDKDTIKTGDTTEVVAVVEPSTAANQNVTFTSSKEEVATVNQNGKVTGLKAGVTEIEAITEDGQKTAQVTITVVEQLIEVTSFDVTTENGLGMVPKGESQALLVVADSESTGLKDIEFEADTSGRIRMNGNYVQGIRKGPAKVTVTATDKANGKVLTKVVPVAVGVSAASLELDQSDIALLAGEKCRIGYKVLPEDASVKEVTFESMDPRIADVSYGGMVTGKQKGETSILVKTKDGGISKICKVTVTESDGSKVKHVKTQEELDAALAQEDLQFLYIEGSEAVRLNIVEKAYPNVTLIVDAPNAHVENHGTFKNVQIRAIGPNTFLENASSNTIYYSAATGHIEIAPAATAAVCIVNGESDVKLDLENNGTVSSLTVDTSSQIQIRGESGRTIPVTATQMAADSTIESEQNMNITTLSALNLRLNAGAEETEVSVDNASHIPSVQGLGRVHINVQINNDTQIVVGENTGESDQKVNVKSAVRCIDVENGENVVTPAESENVYLVPYRPEFTVDNIGAYISPSAQHEDIKRTVTSDDGSYIFENMSIGNYVLYVNKEGYKPVMETLVITSVESDVYNVGAIYLIRDTGDEGETSLHGQLINAQTGQPVEAGLTVKIRQGRNSVTGDALYETETDAEGKYSFGNLPGGGQYTVQVIDNREELPENSNRYITTNFDADVIGGSDNEKNSTVSSALDDGNVRFVLRWGPKSDRISRDLDSHLYGPKADGSGEFHTWYGDKKYAENEVNYADLDVDDIDWEGPETSTVYTNVDGEYRFYIHDYSNINKKVCDQMSKSDATVEVYVGNRLKATYNMPNMEGTLWYVCNYNINTNTLTPVNTVSYIFNETYEIDKGVKEQYCEELRKLITIGDRMLSDNQQGIQEQEIRDQLTARLTDARNVLAAADRTELIPLAKVKMRLHELIYQLDGRLKDAETPEQTASETNVLNAGPAANEIQEPVTQPEAVTKEKEEIPEESGIKSDQRQETEALDSKDIPADTMEDADALEPDISQIPSEPENPSDTDTKEPEEPLIQDIRDDQNEGITYRIQEDEAVISVSGNNEMLGETLQIMTTDDITAQVVYEGNEALVVLKNETGMMKEYRLYYTSLKQDNKKAA